MSSESQMGPGAADKELTRSSQAGGLGREPLMLLLATRMVLPTSPHDTHSSYFNCLISQGGDANMGEKRYGTGTVPTCQPSQCSSPSTPGDLPAFHILHPYVSSFETREQEFSATDLNKK